MTIRTLLLDTAHPPRALQLHRRAPRAAAFAVAALALACQATAPRSEPTVPAVEQGPPASDPPQRHAHGGGPAHGHVGAQSDAPGTEPHEGAHGGHSHAHGQPGLHKDFSDACGFSQHFDDPARDAWQRPAEVMELMRIPSGSVVADLGAGTGYFVPWLSRAVGPSGRVLALDVEANMVDFVRARAQRDKLGNVEARQVASDDPGLEPNSVARVLIVNTWHHIDDRPSYARKLREGLAARGEVWIVDFTLDAQRGPPAKYRLAPAKVVKELEAGGLRAELVEPEQLPEQYVIRAWGGDAQQNAD